MVKLKKQEKQIESLPLETIGKLIFKMNYFFYFISFSLLIFGSILLLIPKKTDRVIHTLIYMFPFWISGLVLLILSVITWQFKSELKNIFLTSLLSLFLTIAGLILIFFPKRKIKKNIEKWENLPIQIKKIYSLIFIILSFFVYSITI